MRVPSTLQGLPDDLLTSDITYSRALKTSADNPLLAAALNDRAFSIAASYSIPAGQLMALNINFASVVVIRKITTNSGFPVSVVSAHATGMADGLFPAHNINLCSIDETPVSSQVFYNASQVGDTIAAGISTLEPMSVACEDSSPCILVKNTGAVTTDVYINVLFEELSERNPSFGITPTTFLQPDTEMSAYG